VLFETLTGFSREATLAKFAGQGYGGLKREVAEVAIEKVTEIQQRYHAIREDDTALDDILASGAERAADVANETLDAAMRATGLR
jgi:tryptophanyl-tRNA synthetase